MMRLIKGKIKKDYHNKEDKMPLDSKTQARIQIGKGNDNQGTFYLVPNKQNGIVCRSLEMAKRIRSVLETFQDIDEGIQRFNYLAFHECPEPELLPNNIDNYQWALNKMEKERGLK